MNKSFNAERLLAALPFRPIGAAENLLGGYEPPAWRYPLLGPYNGFSGHQRVRTWQLSTWLRRRGLLPVVPCCDLCGGSSRLGRHSENYADVQRAITVCRGCHYAIHKRFREPEAWRQKLAALPSIPEWAVALSPMPVDLPGWLVSTGALVDPFWELQRQFPEDSSIENAAKGRSEATYRGQTGR